MEAPTAQRAAEEGVMEELDRLAEKIDRATEFLARLREERDDLKRVNERLRGEQNRLLQEAGVGEYSELLAAITRLQRAEEENAQLRAEREQVSDRLAAIIEKVDLVERDF